MTRLNTNAYLAAAVLLMKCCLATAVAGPGAWDRSYAPTVSGPVYATVLQPDGKLVVGGAFTSVNGSTSRNHLARLLSDGSLDSTFFSTGSGASSIVWTLAVQTSGSIVVGGDFTSINGTTRYHVARLNSNGTVDGSFVPTNAINNSVLALAVQTNNAVVIGGTFSGGTFPSYNARLTADGTTDTSFSSFPNGAVYAIAVQPDGKILIGGAFTTVNGANRNRIARLNADGSLDNTFQNGLTGASANVRCIQIQSDGKVLVGGDFTTVNGSSRSYVARLTTTGILDTGFAAAGGANGSVYAMALQSDGNVLIGGSFSTYTSVNLSRVARLYTDGTRDTTFTNFGINNIVQTLVVQSDGGILIGGTFTAINNTNASYLARLYGNLYPPEFVTQPASRNTNVGANVTFSALVSNPTATSFQWRKEGVNISGATGTSYALFNVQPSDAGNYSVFANNAVGGVTSSNALLQIGVAPSFASQPSSLSVTQGQSATFSASASGTPLNYYWKKNGTLISGQTNSSLSFASVVPTNAATYTCQVSNFLGSITSTGAVLTVAYPPTISIQPVSQTIGVGSNFTVSVTASGNPAVGFQWRTNGTIIDGATAASYTVTGAQTNDSGNYDVVITNSFGSVTSSVANITVIYYPPTIVSQPAGKNVAVGSPFSLSVVASGTAPLSWQWRTNGVPVAAANASSYVVNSAQLTDAGSYDVVVANSVGSITSSVALINVGFAPTVTEQPVSLTNAVGGSTNFSSAVTGTAPINLQWKINGNPIPGATNATLNFTNLRIADIGNYVLTATNLFGGTTSSNCTLSLAGYNFDILNGLVAFYSFNGNATNEIGNTNNGVAHGALLTADRFGNVNAAYSFNGSAYISFGSVPLNQTDNWTMCGWISPSSLSQSGMAIAVGHDDGITGDGYQLGISDGTSLPGGKLYGIFGGVATLDSGYVFSSANQWHHAVMLRDKGVTKFYLDGTQVGPTSTVVPLTPTAFSIGSGAGIRFFQGGIDDVRVYNRALTSNEVAILYGVEADVPVVTQQPQSQSVNAGSTATFTVAATANHSLTYQWNKDGTPIPGATNTILIVTNIHPAQIGYYSVTVSNGVAAIVSSSAPLGIFGYDSRLTNQLVAYYPLNGNVLDALGNGNAGVLKAGAFYTNGFDGGLNSAVAVDGVNAFVLFGKNDAVYPNQLLTWTAWFRAQNTNGIIFWDDDDQEGGDRGIDVFNGVLRAFSGGMTIVSTNFVADNSWHQCAFTSDTNGQFLYLDGTVIGSTNVIIQNHAGQSSVSVGSGQYGGNAYIATLKGAVSNVRIYNRALSSGDIAYLFQFEAQLPFEAPPTLVSSIGAGQSLDLYLTGVPGHTYILQAVTDLTPPISWKPIMTNTTDTNGFWHFTDQPSGTVQKFYRATTP
ncbi:MAG: hypothetical protein JWO95_1069 [Verrucomicrobiales bacterium]|nr:hypothetical protein [Verrucomicrobiales bacterium]